ncbi:MAG: chromosomal replication initiator protein DnaA [Lachnospiraceae bacterium]|nr:chromosomal replication initiator protein DnaA [Lachnospiraceae bacterium]
MIDKIKQNWTAIQNYIKDEFEISDVSFETWILPLVPLNTHHDSEKNLVLDVLIPQDENSFKKYVEKKYSQILKVAVSEISGVDCHINILNNSELKENKEKKSSIINNGKSKVDNYSLLMANLNPKYTFDSFVVGNSNNFAHAASLAVAESPGEIDYNPLFIYGGVGLGKTHLMQAIAHFILEKDPSKKVLYVTSENFTNEIVDAIRKMNTQQFREKYRYNDVLLIDDIQFIIGKESTQEEFFNTFNDMYQNKKQIVISSDRPPKDFENLEERIKSRFSWGLQADIQSPDYETRLAILRKKEETDGISLDNEVIKYIAEVIDTNIRELEGALNKIRMMAKLENKKIDVEFAKEVLKDTLSPNLKKTITPEYILDVVSDHFSTNKLDIVSSKKTKELVYPRQIAMYLMKKLTNYSLDYIGNILGGKDHSTIIYGIKKITAEIEENEELKHDLSILEKKLSTH